MFCDCRVFTPREQSAPATVPAPVPTHSKLEYSQFFFVDIRVFRGTNAALAPLAPGLVRGRRSADAAHPAGIDDSRVSLTESTWSTAREIKSLLVHLKSHPRQTQPGETSRKSTQPTRGFRCFQRIETVIVLLWPLQTRLTSRFIAFCGP
jgi:hypothetical protein